MTENLLLQLEEKVIALLSEMEILRNELKQLRQENLSLRSEKASTSDKLKQLLGQLDDLIASRSAMNVMDYQTDKFSVPA